jgi:hypothetical protein
LEAGRNVTHDTSGFFRRIITDFSAEAIEHRKRQWDDVCSAERCYCRIYWGM